MNNVKCLTDAVAQQESKLLIWLRLSARLVNRDKDLITTTDAHHRLVRVHTQRPRRVYKLSRLKVCAAKTWTYKSRIKT